MHVREQAIINRALPQMLRLRRTNIYRIIQRTIMMLFPFVLIGSFSRLIQVTILSKQGFLASIFRIPAWLPNYSSYHYLFDNLTGLTLGGVSVIGAFGAAKYTAKLFDRDDQLAGITGAMAFLMIAYQYGDQGGLHLNTALIGTNGISVAILVGIGTGELFRWLGKSRHEPREPHTTQILARTFDSLLAIFASVVVALIISLLVNLLLLSGVPDFLIAQFQSLQARRGTLPVTFLVTIITLITALFGFNALSSNVDLNTNASVANLNYALSHHSAYNVPTPYSINTLYHAFGSFGGTGMTMALLVGIILVAKNQNYHLVGRWSILPAMFNINGPVMTGIPVLYNLIYLVPFILAPIISMLIATACIALKLMPPMVYPIPLATPGPLIAFIGTNGNWVALIVGFICFAISIGIYIPFIHLAEAILERVDQEMKAEANDHAD